MDLSQDILDTKEHIEDEENQTGEDQDIGQNSVIEQHAPTIIMDLDRNSY